MCNVNANYNRIENRNERNPEEKETLERIQGGGGEINLIHQNQELENNFSIPRTQLILTLLLQYS